MPERITVTDAGELECLCGNTQPADGYVCGLPDGTVTGPKEDGGWDEDTVICARCGRIISQDDGEVLGRRDPAGVVEEEDALMG